MESNTEATKEKSPTTLPWVTHKDLENMIYRLRCIELRLNELNSKVIENKTNLLVVVEDVVNLHTDLNKTPSNIMDTFGNSQL